MDPVFRFPPSPGTPLFPISPNRQHLPLMHSPSVPANLSDPINNPFFTTVSSRGSFGVQDKVAQFNNLTKENESPRHRERDAALRRAMLGREEAESEIRRMKDEGRTLRRELEDGKQREMKVAARLEAVMEDLVRQKESMAHAQALYEKQIRQAKKEAFKSSSTVLKMREEVKTARNQSTLRREEVEEQKRLAEEKDKALFTVQYQQIGLQEEIDAMKHKLTVAEEERIALKSSLHEEELARLAAEGKLAIPSSSDRDEAEESEDPARIRRDSVKENIDPAPAHSSVDDQVLGEMAVLKSALLAEKRLREHAQDSVRFMKMECQLQCCSCRRAERHGATYLHDPTFNKSQVLNAASKRRSEESQECTKRPKRNEAAHKGEDTPEVARTVSPPADVAPLISFSPSTGTFHTTVSLPEQNPIMVPAHETPTALRSTTPPSPTVDLHDLSTIHESPSHGSESQEIRPTPRDFPDLPPSPVPTAYTTTTRFPIAPIVLTPARPARSIPFSPEVTMSREEALEQIRQRRGRARSVTAGHSTPRRHFSGPSESRRDISAPAKTPTR